MNMKKVVCDVAVISGSPASGCRKIQSIAKQHGLMGKYAHEIGWPFPKTPARFYGVIGNKISFPNTELDRLISDIKSGAVRRVMVYDIGRFARAVPISAVPFRYLMNHAPKIAATTMRRILDLNSKEDRMLIGLSGVVQEMAR